MSLQNLRKSHVMKIPGPRYIPYFTLPAPKNKERPTKILLLTILKINPMTSYDVMNWKIVDSGIAGKLVPNF